MITAEVQFWGLIACVVGMIVSTVLHEKRQHQQRREEEDRERVRDAFD